MKRKQEEVIVNIQMLHPDAAIPKYETEGAAGFDLVAVEEVIIGPGETKTVSLGIAFEIPPGWEIQIRPRSGISSKTKLRQSNSVGTIDSDYRGEVKMIFDNTNKRPEVLNSKNTGAFMAKSLKNEVVRTEVACVEGSYIIKKGDRVAQGILARVPKAKFQEVTKLNSTKRGAGGFGHTGVTA
ncbi:deoxyuridine 5'-triphosphate nucleotidohydrolase [Brevibacillus choshinensis]|uniref:dUTP diphosphatase n=1 Tax=Brevibacillus choshinensis TaxID=54911 RepID=UPI002E1ABD69|nr:deoxyuridine 5'-triphosphate nucleotidohydrolase [Brevibacillus choshinensis]